jgi:hypothetical protein
VSDQRENRGDMTSAPGNHRARILASVALTVCSLAFSMVAGEVVLRLKNRSMTTYDIEMWRYAKELKVRSDDPHLDFDHVRSKASTLQNVNIRLNEWGRPAHSVPRRIDRARMGSSRGADR